MVCATWQHLHCYGFAPDIDPFASTYHHVCYDCLLGAHESEVLFELQDLVLRRRAVYLLYAIGLSSETDLGVLLGE